MERLMKGAIVVRLRCEGTGGRPERSHGWSLGKVQLYNKKEEHQ
jgi:hypothetical protein